MNVILWIHFKDKMFTSDSMTIAELKTRIRKEIAAIPTQELDGVMQNLSNRFQPCLLESPHHIMIIVIQIGTLNDR